MPDETELGEKTEAVIAALVASGRFASKTEVLCEGVRLIAERERAALDDALAAGLEGAAEAERLPRQG